ncbi:hypothetical protein SAMN05661080_02901 [Modestobacter sp. DSM 44400]|uniref:hypothetical protein n=1 Tax=Modestobacter sp. DSM 44400 TaxID=1550230 RepID=UPI00089AB513|nr:hypothetical protein [Modestobacter sp. DSM 44400]SDY26508.1 hypothetical protein SAMN05661080_02901 [Modestobacter sp. DSM 44400]
MAAQKTARQLQALLANTSRHYPEDNEAIENLRQEWRAAQMREYINAALATFPPLTSQQCDQLAGLFRSNATPAVQPGKEQSSARSGQADVEAWMHDQFAAEKGAA